MDGRAEVGEVGGCTRFRGPVGGEREKGRDNGRGRTVESLLDEMESVVREVVGKIISPISPSSSWDIRPANGAGSGLIGETERSDSIPETRCNNEGTEGSIDSCFISGVVVVLCIDAS